MAMGDEDEYVKLFTIDVPPDVYNSMKDEIKKIVRGEKQDCESKYVGGDTDEKGVKNFTYRWLCVDKDGVEERTLIYGFFGKKKDGKNIFSEFEVQTIGGVVTKRAATIRSMLVEKFSGKLVGEDEKPVEKIILGEGKFCSLFEGVIPVEICTNDERELSLISKLNKDFGLYAKFSYYAVQKYRGMLTREKHPIVFAQRFSKSDLDLYELDYGRLKKMFEIIKESGLYDRSV